MLDELLDVLTLPNIRRLHRATDAELLEYLAAIISNAQRHRGSTPISARVTRDMTDTKFLSVAVEAEAQFLVTNDHRHLLPIVKFGRTRIVTPAAFLRELH